MAPGETQFWQLCNSSTDAFYKLELPGGRFQVVEEDGAEVWESWFPETILLSPGKRYGILVTAPKAPGLHTLRSVGYNQGPFGQWPEVALAYVEVAGRAARSVAAPLQMGTAPAFIAQKPVKQRILDLGAAQADQDPVFWFDDVPFEKITMKDVISVEVNTVEDWVIRNGTMTSMGTFQESHPYHQHVNDFAVVERGTYDPVTGKVLTRIKTSPRSTADTMIVQPGEWVRIRTHFDRFVGRSVYHCHIVFHEDRGMMGIFDIVNADGSGVGADQKLPTQTHAMHGM
jgi:FtsP/CotA-like multicopper oxidase with cupredoxin domain